MEHLFLSTSLLFLTLIFGFSVRSINGTVACEATLGTYLKTSSSIIKTRKFRGFDYAGFSSFDQLNINCDLGPFKNKEEISFFTFKPTIPILFDQSINMSDLNTQHDVVFDSYFQIMIFNIKGFSLSASPFLLIDDGYENVFLLFLDQMYFDFYLNGSLIDQDACDANLMETQEVGLFTNLFFTQINIQAETTYSNPICPYVFKNADILGFTWSSLSYDYFTKTVPEFLEIKNAENRTIELNSTIMELWFRVVYRFRMTKKIVNPYVFKNVRIVFLIGVIEYIEEDVFKVFKNLVKVELQAVNLRDFLHFSDNKWMSYIDYHRPSYANYSDMLSKSPHVNANNLTRICFRSMGVYSYEYPDEDLCLFQYLPFDKLILVLLQDINMGEKLEASVKDSCTKAFLTQNYEVLFNRFKSFMNYEAENFTRASEAFIESCNLSHRIQLCRKTNFTRVVQSPRIYYYDFQYTLQWFEFIGSMITFPLVSLVGFLLNLITILVIKHECNKDEFERRLFQFILLTAFFNCIECLLSSLRLIGACIKYNSDYCSTVRLIIPVQYFEVYGVAYLGEVMKTGSILTGLAFSLERYIDTSGTKRRFLITFAKVRLQKICTCIVLISMLTCIPKTFEYIISYTQIAPNDQPNQFYFSTHYRFNAKHVFYFLHYILNDFVILMVNLIVDVFLIFSIKKQLKRKLQIKIELSELGQNEAVGGSKSSSLKNRREALRRHRELIESFQTTEKKTNKMIIFSLIVYLFCRVPEFVGYVFFYFHKTENSQGIFYCEGLDLCQLIANVIDYFYNISNVTNIFFYYHFNRNFRTGFKRYFNIKNKEDSK